MAEDLSFTNSYDDCLSFADQFDNTCTSREIQYDSVEDIPSETATCSTAKTCPEEGTLTYPSCEYVRRLCVSCFMDDDTVMIRVQTNGMPNHCWRSPSVAPEYHTIDWQVEWMKEMTEERS